MEKKSDFPHLRPVTLVVPHGRGGSTDTAVRIVTRNAEKYLGCPINIINLQGINGFFALDLMVDSIKAKPDGYSLGTANSSIILSPMVSRTKYNYMDEIKPIAMSAEEPFFMAVAKNAPWKTLGEFIKDAKAKPGSIKFGHSGIGNVSHIIAEILKIQAGIELTPQGYDSGGQLVKGFAAGEADCLMSNRVDLNSFLKSGEARVLAVAGYERSKEPLISHAPTFLESGYNIVAYLRQGIGVSNNVPEENYKILCKVFEKMINETDTKTLLEEAGMSFKYMPGEEYKKLWEREKDRWQNALDNGIRELIKNEIAKTII